MVKITLVDIGYNALAPVKVLEKNIKKYQVINYTKSVSLPQFIIQDNLKTVLKQATDNNSDDRNTKNIIIILFAVMGTNQYVLMKNMVDLIIIRTLVKILLINLLVIQQMRVNNFINYQKQFFIKPLLLLKKYYEN